MFRACWLFVRQDKDNHNIIEVWKNCCVGGCMWSCQFYLLDYEYYLGYFNKENILNIKKHNNIPYAEAVLFILFKLKS